MDATPVNTFINTPLMTNWLYLLENMRMPLFKAIKSHGNYEIKLMSIKQIQIRNIYTCCINSQKLCILPKQTTALEKVLASNLHLENRKF